MLKEFTKSVATAFSFDPLKDYRICHERSFRACRGQFFLVEDAVERRSGKPVSVFSVKRKDLQVACGGEAKMQQYITLLQRSVAFLSQLHHPCLLSIEKPFTDSGALLFFVTERVTAYLPSVNMQSIPIQARKFELQHLLTVIRFLHERCNLLLLDFGPHSVYLTSSGWKIGDLFHSMLKNDLTKFSRIGDFSQVTSPFMNYVADECIAIPKPLKEESPSSIKQTLDSLFEGPAPARSSEMDAPSLIPHSDVFSFLVTAVEVLEEKKLFTCRPGDISERQRQMPRVQGEVASMFPIVESLSSPLRPPLLSISQSASINGDDIRMLLEVENLSTSSSETASFDVLKALYHGIGDRLYCNDMLRQVVLVFALRAAKQQRMLRFVLPIVIQCGGVLASDNTVPKELKDFLITVVEGIIRAPTFEVTGTLAQQLLEKLRIIQKIFSADQERQTIFLPLFFKCMASTNETLQVLSIRALNDLFRQINSSRNITNDGSGGGSSVKLPEKFVERLLVVMEHGNDEAFSLVIETTSIVSPMLSPEQKRVLEVSLVGGLRTTLPHYPKRLVPILGVLYSIQRSMPLEHTASTTIPLLSSLLLSSSADIRNYAASTIFQRLAAFDVKINNASALLSSAPDFTKTTVATSSFSINTDTSNGINAKESEVMSPSFDGLAGGALEYQKAMSKTSVICGPELASQKAYGNLFSSVVSGPQAGMVVHNAGNHSGVVGSSGNAFTSSHPLLASSSPIPISGVAPSSYSSFDPASSAWNSSSPPSNSFVRPIATPASSSTDRSKPSSSPSQLDSLWR